MRYSFYCLPFPMQESSLTVRLPDNGLILKNVYLKTGEEPVPFVSGEGQTLYAVHNGYSYTLNLTQGFLQLREDDLLFFPDEDGVVRMSFLPVEE